MSKQNKPVRGLLLLTCVVAGATASAGNLEVRVSGVASAKGSVHVAVCDKETFLKQCKLNASVAARVGDTVLTVPGVPAGSWAVLSYHDENANGELDRNLIGIPKEDYGFSRDARGRFGPPDFEQAAITVTNEPSVVALKLK